MEVGGNINVIVLIFIQKTQAKRANEAENPNKSHKPFIRFMIQNSFQRRHLLVILNKIALQQVDV